MPLETLNPTTLPLILDIGYCWVPEAVIHYLTKAAALRYSRDVVFMTPPDALLLVPEAFWLSEL